jgi:hypothetical protein
VEYLATLALAAPDSPMLKRARSPRATTGLLMAIVSAGKRNAELNECQVLKFTWVFIVPRENLGNCMDFILHHCVVWIAESCGMVK